jgi:hypothetical protein
MENHIKFLQGEQSKFLHQIQEKSGLPTETLAKMAKIVPRSYRDWKREKLNMTLKSALFFQEEFGILLPEAPSKMILRWEKHRSKMGKRGGIACFNKHGSPATLEGRKKGGTKTMAILRAKGIIPESKRYDLPNKFDEDLAELVGILLGDGGITMGQTVITLNSEADKDYVLYVNELENKLFKVIPKNIGTIARRL